MMYRGKSKEPPTVGQNVEVFKPLPSIHEQRRRRAQTGQTERFGANDNAASRHEEAPRARCRSYLRETAPVNIIQQNLQQQQASPPKVARRSGPLTEQIRKDYSRRSRSRDPQPSPQKRRRENDIEEEEMPPPKRGRGRPRKSVEPVAREESSRRSVARSNQNIPPPSSTSARVPSRGRSIEILSPPPSNPQTGQSRASRRTVDRSRRSDDNTPRTRARTPTTRYSPPPATPRNREPEPVVRSILKTRRSVEPNSRQQNNLTRNNPPTEEPILRSDEPAPRAQQQASARASRRQSVAPTEPEPPSATPSSATRSRRTAERERAHATRYSPPPQQQQPSSSARRSGDRVQSARQASTDEGPLDKPEDGYMAEACVGQMVLKLYDPDRNPNSSCYAPNMYRNLGVRDNGNGISTISTLISTLRAYGQPPQQRRR